MELSNAGYQVPIKWRNIDTKGIAILKKNSPKGKPPVAKPSRFDKKSRSVKSRPSRRRGRKGRHTDIIPYESDNTVVEENWDASRFKVPVVEGQTRFHDFDLPDPLMHAIFDLGFKYCT